MPIIEITVLDSASDEKCKELIEKVSRATWDVLKCPRNRITVFVNKVPRGQFAEGGVLADAPNFLTDRDLTSYE
ncbi:4-oxalocrotonate tautomerase [Azospirillaceae bacterium]